MRVRHPDDPPWWASLLLLAFLGLVSALCWLAQACPGL